MNCIMDVLLPEELIHLCFYQYSMTCEQADKYLPAGNKEEANNYIAQLQKKYNKRKKSQKRGTLKRGIPNDADEVQFIKRSKLDKQSILKMRRPGFRLDKEDVAISKSAMLTDKHIQMAQELLHQQFPLIEGLIQPSIGKVDQFPVMRQEFIQVL